MLTEEEIEEYEEAQAYGDGRAIHNMELVAEIRLEEKKMEEEES